MHPTLRPTEDVDCVVAVLTYSAFGDWEERLSQLGCQRCTDEGVVCRWWVSGIRVDFMPAHERVLGLRSRWYQEILGNPVKVLLEGGLEVSVVNLPVFLATKFDAFSDRGRGDFYGNSDFEDIVTVLAYRVDALELISTASAEIRDYLSSEAAAFLNRTDCETLVSGCLPGDRISQSAVGPVLETLRLVAGLSEENQ